MAQKYIFLPGSKPIAFVSSYTLNSSFPKCSPILSPFPLQLRSLVPFLHFFLFLSIFSCFIFLLSFFLPGKFENFSYLPASAATTLLQFFKFESRNTAIRRRTTANMCEIKISIKYQYFVLPCRTSSGLLCSSYIDDMNMYNDLKWRGYM